MEWRVSQSAKGALVLRGYIDRSERLSCQLLKQPQALRDVCERIVAARLADIAAGR